MSGVFNVYEKREFQLSDRIMVRRYGCSGTSHVASFVHRFNSLPTEESADIRFIEKGPCDGTCKDKKTGDCFVY